jgi:sugar diacid utilization regulator
LMQQLDRGRERELLRDLLSDQADVRQHAVDELIERKLLIPSDLVVALVVRPVRERSGMSPADTTVRGRVERVLTRARHRVAPRQALHLVRPDHGVLLVTCATHHLNTVEDVAAELHKYTAESVAGDGKWRAFVGIGDPQKDLSDSHESYTQARKTAEVAGLLNLGGAVAKWSDLGVYQTLVQLPLSDVDTRSLHPGLAKLFGARDSEIWLKTLECYLDMGCDARGAARTLFINRGSLYHRIHRIEEIAGVSLGNGDDRLALHLGLKLARLAGLLDGSTTA